MTSYFQLGGGKEVHSYTNQLKIAPRCHTIAKCEVDAMCLEFNSTSDVSLYDIERVCMLQYDVAKIHVNV